MSESFGPGMSRRQFIGGLSAASAALAVASDGADSGGGEERPLGVALAGLGGYSHGELGPALRLTSNCRLAGAATGDREKGLRWAREYGFPERNIYHYDRMQDMSDNPDIDIVYVVTPNGLHAEHAIAAARAGKHVICEKPMANTVAECDAIIAACRAARVKLSIGYRLHFDPYHEVLRELVRTEEFGPFTRMDGGFAFRLMKHQWRATRSLAGGGPLMDLGIYVVQECCMAAGAAPVAVTARELPKRRPEFFQDVEETIEWTMEFANGAAASCITSYDDRYDRFRSEASGGWFELSPAYIYRGLRGATSKGRINFAPPVNQQALQMDDFARCVREGVESRVGGDMGRRDMVIIEAIYASAARGGERVAVGV